MRYIRRKTIAVTISTLLLGACGMKMLWQVSPSTPAPEIASTLATDAANNSYVGYVTVDDWSNGSMTSRISKLDKNGAILWSIELPAKAIISKIITLTPDVLAVATKSPLDETSAPQVFLMATSDGAMLHELPAASGFEFGKSDLMLGNTGEHIYVARSTNACGFLEACDNGGHASLEVFDANGERLHAQSFSTQNIRNIAIDEQGRIAVALSDARQQSVQLYDHDLQLKWATSSTNATESLRYCNTMAMTLRQGETGILCESRIVKLDANGGLLFASDQSDLLHSDYVDDYHPFKTQLWQGNSSIQFDSHGDIYAALTRAEFYGVSVGPIQLPMGSILKSDAVLLKLNGGTGQRAWSDDVNTPLFVSNNQINSYFYYPIALSLTDDRALLTVRGLAAIYSGFPSGQNNGFSCVFLEDWYGMGGGFPFNTCQLDQYQERYGKTFAYRTADGKRLSETRHNIPYPRAATLDSDGNLVVLGDNQSGYMDNWTEFFAKGMDAVLSEEISHDDNSDIVLQKYKP